MKIKNTALIEDLIGRTKGVMNEAEAFKQLKMKTLNWKAVTESWSILECIEHLNRYGDYYLPEIEQRIKNAKVENTSLVFKSGWLGNYFAKSMLPKEQLNTMKTFKAMNPVGSNLDESVLAKFINQQKKLLALLNQSRTIDLTKTKTGVSISKWIKLRLGDTFRVVIYHNQRHIVQAKRAREESGVRLKESEIK